MALVFGWMQRISSETALGPSRNSDSKLSEWSMRPWLLHYHTRSMSFIRSTPYFFMPFVSSHALKRGLHRVHGVAYHHSRHGISTGYVPHCPNSSKYPPSTGILLICPFKYWFVAANKTALAISLSLPGRQAGRCPHLSLGISVF